VAPGSDTRQCSEPLPALQQEYQLPQYSSIALADGPVEFAEEGHGPTILYFHGTSGGCEVVFPMEQELLDAGFRLLVPNRPGYFGTPLAGRTSGQACARLASAVLDSLGVSRVAVIGTSGGGPAALSFAASFPERTSALILQCAQTHRWDDLSWWPKQNRWIYPLTRTPWARRLMYVGYVWNCRLVYRWPKAFIKGMADTRFDEIRDDPATWKLYRALRGPCLKSLSQPAGMRNDWEVVETGAFANAQDVKCPTLVIYDPADPMVPQCHPKWALSEIPGARACELQAGGHLIWLGKDADRMQRERLAFLREHAR
jgi:pimeloyl-ACP methyl ester carboxylesterase